MIIPEDTTSNFKNLLWSMNITVYEDTTSNLKNFVWSINITVYKIIDYLIIKNIFCIDLL